MASNEKKYYVGIDFGTSNIKACTSSNGRARYVNLSKNANSPWEPNVVSRRQNKDGTFSYLFGNSAIADHSLNSSNKLLFNVKSMLENERCDITFEDGFVTDAKALSSEIFRFCYDRTVVQRANNEPAGTVLTVPVCYSEVQRNRIVQSAHAGGVNVSGVVSEPVASIFAFEEYEDFLDDHETRIVFVLDFGGGTIDGALVQLKYNPKEDTRDVTVLASNGINYGGSDINQAIWDRIVKPQIDGEHLALIESQAREKATVFQKVENAKVNLFDGEDYDGDGYDAGIFQHTFVDGKTVSIRFEKKDIESIFEDAKIERRLIDMLDRIFYDDADMDVEDVTNVHFIGGGSAITYFRKILTKYFANNTNIDGLEDFDEEETYMYVSNGASKYAEVLDNPESSKVVFRNRCAFAIVGSNGIQYIQRNSIYGLKTIKRPVVVESMEDGTRCMKFFQEIDGFDSKVYVGYFPFSNQKWSDKAVFFDMQICYDGSIKGEFYDVNNVSLGTCNMIMEDD